MPRRSQERMPPIAGYVQKRTRLMAVKAMELGATYGRSRPRGSKRGHGKGGEENVSDSGRRHSRSRFQAAGHARSVALAQPFQWKPGHPSFQSADLPPAL